MVLTPSNPQDFFPPYPPISFAGCPKCGHDELAPTWSMGPRSVFGWGTVNGEHLLWTCRCGYRWVTATLDNSGDAAGDPLDFEGAMGPTGLLDLDRPPGDAFAVRPEPDEPVVPCAVCGVDVLAGLKYVRGSLAGYAFCDDHEIPEGKKPLDQFAAGLAKEAVRVRYHVAPLEGYSTGWVINADGPAVVIRDDERGEIVTRDPRRTTVLR